MATEELAAKLSRRTLINEAEGGSILLPSAVIFNPYTEFKEFSRKQIQDFQRTFNKFDVGNDKFLDLMELKLMMERLGVPQTHLTLKSMIQEVDEDNDNKISFREFLLIFRKAAAGDLQEESGLHDLYRNTKEINVDIEGVKGATSFFQAKIKQHAESSKFEREIREEQEEKKRQAEDAKERNSAFKERANIFSLAHK